MNISGFGKIQYGRHFFKFLNYDLLYLGKYSTDLNGTHIALIKGFKVNI